MALSAKKVLYNDLRMKNFTIFLLCFFFPIIAPANPLVIKDTSGFFVDAFLTPYGGKFNFYYQFPKVVLTVFLKHHAEDEDLARGLEDLQLKFSIYRFTVIAIYLDPSLSTKEKEAKVTYFRKIQHSTFPIVFSQSEKLNTRLTVELLNAKLFKNEINSFDYIIFDQDKKTLESGNLKTADMTIIASTIDSLIRNHEY